MKLRDLNPGDCAYAEFDYVGYDPHGDHYWLHPDADVFPVVPGTQLELPPPIATARRVLVARAGTAGSDEDGVRRFELRTTRFSEFNVAPAPSGAYILYRCQV